MTERPEKGKPTPDEPMRIQKYLSRLGVAPRRQVEEALAKGEITLDGVEAQPGNRLVPGEQEVEWRGHRYRELLSDEYLTLALHKPKGTLSSHSDPHHDKTIMRCLPQKYRTRKWVLAGRLDRESEGLMILSEDGALVQTITHPSHEVQKRYQVWIRSKEWTEEDRTALLEGIQDEGEFLKAWKVGPPRREGDETLLEIILKQGHKREIRRLLRSRGKVVTRLLRVQIGPIELGELRPGDCRLLEREEILNIKRIRPPQKAVRKKIRR